MSAFDKLYNALRSRGTSNIIKDKKKAQEPFGKKTNYQSNSLRDVSDRQQKTLSALESRGYSPQELKEEFVDAPTVRKVADTKNVISDYSSKFGLTKEEYNRRRATNSSLPAYGSYDYFVNEEKEVGKLLDKATNKIKPKNQEETGYGANAGANISGGGIVGTDAYLAKKYSEDPSQLKGDTLKRAKKAYGNYQTLLQLQKEYKNIVDNKNTVRERGIDKYGNVDVDLGVSNAKQDKKESKRLIRSQEAIDSYKNYGVVDQDSKKANLIKEAKDKGVDIYKTKYGNINTNKRMKLEWDKDNLDKYDSELKSWGISKNDVKGSVSTVLGGSGEYNGVEIAYSPILQTAQGARLIGKSTMDKYINRLIGEMKEGWTKDDLLAKDREGLKIDGITVRNVIADVGDSARTTGEAMHYVGKDGAIAQAYQKSDPTKRSTSGNLDNQDFEYYNEDANSLFDVFGRKIPKSEKKGNDKRNLGQENRKSYEYYDSNENNNYDVDFGDNIFGKVANALHIDDIYGRFAGNVRLGDINQKQSMGTGYAEYKAGTKDLEGTEVYQALQDKLTKNNKDTLTNNNLFESAIASVAQYIPQLRDQYIARYEGYAIGALIGSVFGNPKAGMKIGGAIVSAKQMFQQTAGDSYVNLIQSNPDISAEEAQKIATDDAIIQSAIEFISDLTFDNIEYLVPGKAGKILRSAPGELIEDFDKKLAQKGISEGGKAAAKRAAVVVGAHLLGGSKAAVREGTEEGLQGITGKAAQRLAKEGKNADVFDILAESARLDKLSKEDWAEIGSEAAAGAFLGAVMDGAGIGRTQIGGTVNKTVQKTVKTLSNVSDSRTIGKILTVDGSDAVLKKYIDYGIKSENKNVQKKAVSVYEDLENGKKNNYKIGTMFKGIVNEKLNNGTLDDLSLSNIQNEEDFRNYVLENAAVNIAKNNIPETVSETNQGTVQQSTQEQVQQTPEATKATEVTPAETEVTPVTEVTQTANVQEQTSETPDFLGNMPNTETVVSSNPVIRNFESYLVEKGVSDEYVPRMISAAEKIVNAPQEKFSFNDIVKSVGRSTTSTVESVQKTLGTVGDEDILTTSTMEFVSSPNNLFTTDFVNDFANYFTQAIEATNSVMLRNMNTADLPGALASYVINGYAGEEYQNDRYFQKIAEDFKSNLINAVGKNFMLHNNIYGQNPYLTAQVNDIQNGDFSSFQNAPVSTQAENNVSNVIPTQEEVLPVEEDSDENVLQSEQNNDIIGNETTAYTNDNQEIKLRFKVVPISELIVSNNPDGSINKNYPQELQPRDRTRISSVQQIQNIANNLVPERMGESNNVSDGSPIVGSDNVVESGNGRTLALMAMYRNNPEKSAEYVNYITENADKFGIEGELPENPVLVRERLTDVDRTEFVRVANESNLSSMSATEKAKVDAGRITNDILDLLVANDEGQINTTDNKDFINSVIQNVFNENERNDVVGSDGMLSANGLERITNAIFYKAYNDDTLASKLSESLDNDIKNVTKVLLNIAPKVAKVKSGIQDGIYYDVDFSENLVKGAKLFSELKSKKYTLDEYLEQVSFADDYNDIEKEIASIFEQKSRGAKQATEFFNGLMDRVVDFGNPDQISFDANEDVTKEEAFLDAIDRFNKEREERELVHPKILERRNQTGSQDVDGSTSEIQQGDRSGEESGAEETDSGTENRNEEVKSEKVKEDSQEEPPSKTALSDAVINKLEEKGGKLWEKGDYKRVYFNSNKLGLEVSRRKSGSIESATLNGESISNSLAGKLYYSKNFIDAKTGEISCANEFRDTLQSILNEAKGAIENGQRPEVLAGESVSDDRGLRSGTSEADQSSDKENYSQEDNKGSGETSTPVLQSDSVTDGGNRPNDGNASTGADGIYDAESVSTENTGTDGENRGVETSESKEKEPSKKEETPKKEDASKKEEPVESDTEEKVDEEIAEESEEADEEQKETIETVDSSVTKKRPSNKENFRISESFAETLDDNAPNIKDNIAAIELLLQLEQEGRPATEEEKEVLAKYKGWGGVNIYAYDVDYATRRKVYDYFDSEQISAMEQSMDNAYFTPTKVVSAIYKGLEKMGFKGGNILEPSMGTGNFFGMLPEKLNNKSALTGVELESYTARIAQYLYPGATVINKPFQDVTIRNGSFDVVVGNVPFGTLKLPYQGKKYSLHNYFIVSALDKLKNNGVMAVITSAGTLDSAGIDARKAIMDRADVVACYKLPAKVFSRNAKTDVQTDLLILRKRATGESAKGDSILNVVSKDGLRINEYFEKHPENILGTLAKGKNQWGEITTVLPSDDFYDRLENAMSKLPKNLFKGEAKLEPVETIVTTESKPHFFEMDGKVYFDDGAGTATALETRKGVIRDYIAVREAYRKMLNAYKEDLPESEIEPLRNDLTKAYNKFVKNHGPITGDGKKKIGKEKTQNNTFLSDDSDYYLLSGLEIYDKKKGNFSKSALFEKDTLRKKKVTSVDNSSDALIVSLNETGKIDFERMSELTGKTESQLVKDLKGEIVYTPEGNYELTDVYLSGNIYEKLEAVKGKKEFAEQEKMLQAVLPKPVEASSINVKLGANYIDPKYISQFAREVFGEYRLPVSKDHSGGWNIEGVRQARYGEAVTQKYGCPAFNAVQLLDKILNDSPIVAYKKEKSGDKTIQIFDEKMTDIANQKADDIREAFENWIFKDAERRNAITKNYNLLYNNYRPLDYKRIAEKLTFSSMDDSLRKKLYPHQKNGIARALFGGNVLFAHGVGTGKTFEMIASVMEAKRMGIINKTAMVVPNNKVVDFKNDIMKAYPDAKVLVVDTANKKRQSMLGLVNSNDWDIVLLAKSTFTKIPVSEETERNYTQNLLDEIEIELQEARADRSTKKSQISSLEKREATLKNRINELNSETERDENGVNFEELGIDCIVVDEAHNYKSVPTISKLDIKGLVNKKSSQIASDMLMKLDWLRTINGKIIFGTGTPITNTVSEIYNMMRMVNPEILTNAGIRSLDEWVNTFAIVDQNVELNIDNTIKSKPTRTIRKFTNSNAMMGMFRQMADVVHTEDVVKNLPKAVYKDIKISSKPEHIEIENQITSALQSATGSRLRSVYGKIMSMATAGSVDLRMLSGAESEYNPFKDYSLDELEYEDSKINTMCDIVYDEYKNSNDIKGTQIIFCDSGAGSGEIYSFNLHKDIAKKLEERGIKKEEIVVVRNQKDAQLEELYEKVNNGEVRVLIGTSAKMAEGLNVQERVVAIHHPTVTYKPSDWEQSNARGVRAGNINDEVRIYRYLQENTFDSHKWQAQDRKGEMIKNALKGENVGELEDIGADDEGGAEIDAATAMAITSGNPLVKEKIDIDKEVKRLKGIKSNYMNEIYHYQDTIATAPRKIQQYSSLVEKIKTDIATRDSHKDNVVNVKGTRFDKQEKANKAIVEAVKKTPKDGNFHKIAEYKGFDVMFKGDTGGLGYEMQLKGSDEHFVAYVEKGNAVARFEGALKRLDADQKRLEQEISTLKASLEFAKKEVNKPFQQEELLTQAVAKQKDITTRYENYGKNNVKSSKRAATDGESVWKAEKIQNEKEREAKPLSEIVSLISKKFNIPISTGKVTEKGASAIYKPNAEAIRTKVANNLPDIAHEVGHHLFKLYDLGKSENIEQLKDAIGDDFLGAYKTKERNEEAVAEFVRVYLTNPSQAERIAPEFYFDFVGALSKQDVTSLNELSSEINAYLSLGSAERYEKAISYEKTMLEKAKSVDSDFVKTKAEQYYTKWVDSFFPIKQATDYVENVSGKQGGRNNAYILATNSRNAHEIANNIATNEFRDLYGRKVENGKSFVECIKNINKKDFKLFDQYLVLKHSLEWIEPNVGATKKTVFGDYTLENTETIQERIKNIEMNHPEFIKSAENVYEYQDNLLKHWVIPAGGISKETYDSLKRKYPFYVPFYRDIKAGNTNSPRSTFANQTAPIKRAKGSGLEIISPLESIIRNTENMVKFATRNSTMRVLANYADNVEGFGKFMESVPPDMVPRTVDISDKVEKINDALMNNVDADAFFSLSNAIEEILGNSVTGFDPVANAKKHIVTVMKDGKASYYQVHDDLLYESVAELSPKELNKLINISGRIMQPIKALITQNNPVFATTNILRDIQTAYKLSPTSNVAEFMIGYVQSAKQILANDDMYKLYKSMGGGHSSELSANIRDIQKTLRDVNEKDAGMARRMLNAMLHPIQIVASINDYAETIPRYQEFVRTINYGGDAQEAIFNADDITTNFKRIGSGAEAKAANKIFMFTNAQIQGLDKLARELTTKDKKKRKSTLLKFALSGLLTTAIQALLLMILGQEDEYETLSSYKKNNFFNFPLGDGKFLTIPKPRELAMLDSFTERTVELVFMGNKDSFYDFGGYVAQNILPPFIGDLHSVLGNTIIGGFVDLGYNEDFKGTPIESGVDEWKKVNERENEKTTIPAHLLGQTKFAVKNGLSPKKIDHLIANYTGIIGQSLKALLPMNPEQRDYFLGLRNKFVSDSAYSTDVINMLYDNLEDIEGDFTVEKTGDNAIDYEKAAVVTSFCSGMNKAVKSLPNDQQREGRKYMLRCLNRWNYETTSAQKKLSERYKDAEFNENAIIDSVPSSLIEFTNGGVKYRYQMKPKEYEEYILEYLEELDDFRNSIDNVSDEDYETRFSEGNSEIKKELKAKYKSKYYSKAEKYEK